MIEHSLDTATSILSVRLQAPLTRDDFVQLAETADPYIEKTGGLAGLVVEAPAFPGWDSLGAMAAHFRFVRDHHRHIKRIALVTDIALAQVAERLATHFVSAEIKRFPAGELDAAKRWITSRP